MPVVVPDTSVLHPSPSRMSQGRSPSGASQAAGPFSDILASSDEAPAPAVPKRADAADRGQAKPSTRTDKAPTKRQSSAETAKPEKPKKGAETKDGTKSGTAAAASDAEETSVTNDGSAGPQADIGVKTDLPGDAAASESEPDPLLLLAAVPALDAAKAVAGLQTVPVPVVAPAPPPAIIVTTTPAANTSAAVTETVAVEAAVAAPAAQATGSIDVKSETGAPVDADVADSTQLAAPVKQINAPLKEAVAEPKIEVAAETDAAAAPAPHDDAGNILHTARASKVPEAAPESSESKLPGARPEITAKLADGRAETPVPAVDANAARTNSEPTSSTNALPAPAAVSAAAAAHTAQAPASPTAQAAPAVAVPLAGLAIEIAAKAQSGKNRFEIRLDPPELGRIHVRLDFDRDGNVTSRLVVDRSETLDLLRRDAPNLERAFQQAGLKTSDNGLQFSLRDQSFSGRDNGSQTQPMARLVVPEDKLVAVELQRNHIRLAGLGGGIDIRV